MKVSLSKVYQFSAAHRLNSDALNAQRNVDIYEKCNNLNGHGHDYTLEVTLSGNPDPKTGMILPLPEFDKAVEKVLAQLDHKHINLEVDFFKKNISTAEIIIQYLWDEIEKVIPGDLLYHLKLWETYNNYFEYGKEQFS